MESLVSSGQKRRTMRGQYDNTIEQGTICHPSHLCLLCAFCSNAISEFLLDGLNILKNRGYDSAGMATMATKPNTFLVRILVTFFLTIYSDWHGNLTLKNILQISRPLPSLPVTKENALTRSTW
jgi:hypothetical protein